MSLSTLTAASEPYLPIVRAYMAANPALRPALRERLFQHIEADLRPEN
jgi:hypothetical protein